jgi:hypothetical protein
MKLMRRLAMCALSNNFAIYSVYVPGDHNNIADSFSRLQMDRFRELAPDAAGMGTPCPPLPAVLWTAQ